MTNYTDPDGWLLIEDRAATIGSPAQRMSRIIGHPIDIYRRRFPDWTAGLDDLQVLALWHAAEVDRRLNEIGLTSSTIAEFVASPPIDLEVLRLRVRAAYGFPVRDPNAWLKVTM